MKAPRRIVASAPARANLLGNPSDLYGGAVLGCSVPLRAHVAIEAGAALELSCGDERLLLTARGDLKLRGDVFDVARAALAAELDRFADACGGSGRELLPALRIRYGSEIPFGSGLAGSTALLVALLYGLAAWRGETPSPYVLAERARVTERHLLGVGCGWVDHYLCSFGGLRYVDLRGKQRDAVAAGELYATVEDLGPYVPRLPFVLAFTGVAHHSGSVHAPIRARWERGEPAVREAYRRMAAIALEGKRALLHEDWPRLGGLFDENHALTRELGGSGDANERLIDAALRVGAFGAKLAGAGGGGTVVVLWPDRDSEPLERALFEAGASAMFRPAVEPGVEKQEDS